MKALLRSLLPWNLPSAPMLGRRIAFILAAVVWTAPGFADAKAPQSPVVAISYGMKQIQFDWDPVIGATHYRLLKNADGHSGFSAVGAPIPSTITTVVERIGVHLLDWGNARYVVAACNSMGCSWSREVIPTLTDEVIGFFKASNTQDSDVFGAAVALSGDGKTLAVGAPFEDSGAAGINGNELDKSRSDSGAVYIFVRRQGRWRQQAYIKSDIPETKGFFGISLTLSYDGRTLAVGSTLSDRALGYIDDGSEHYDEENPPPLRETGALFVYKRTGSSWSQDAYIPPPTLLLNGDFPRHISMSADGRTVIALQSALDGQVERRGSAYVFRRNGQGWRNTNTIRFPTVNDHCVEMDATLDAKLIAVSCGKLVNGSHTQQDGNVFVYALQDEKYVLRDQLVGGGYGWWVAFDAFGRRLAKHAWDGELFQVPIDVYRRSSGTWSLEQRLTPQSGLQYLPTFDMNANGRILSAGHATFVRKGRAWTVRSTVPFLPDDDFASNSYGHSVSLSASGATLAVGAPANSSAAHGINGDRTDASQPSSGALYLY